MTKPRVPIEHDLKTWPEFFEAIWKEVKQFEIRKDDRAYAVGDILKLREWSTAKGYSGRAVRATVSYVLNEERFGMQAGFCVMSIVPFEWDSGIVFENAHSAVDQ